MHMNAHRMHHKWTGHLEPLHAGARPGNNAQQQLPGVVAPVGDADLQGAAAWPVMATTLPNLMADDSLNMATTLCFEVRNAS